MTKLTPSTPEQVRQARIDAGMTLRECAERFGYQLQGWQKKENTGSSYRALSLGEWELLLLLANQHPDFTLQKNSK